MDGTTSLSSTAVTFQAKVNYKIVKLTLQLPDYIYLKILYTTHSHGNKSSAGELPAALHLCILLDLFEKYTPVHTSSNWTKAK